MIFQLMLLYLSIGHTEAWFCKKVRRYSAFYVSYELRSHKAINNRCSRSGVRWIAERQHIDSTRTVFSQKRWLQEQRLNPIEMSTKDDDIKAELSNTVGMTTLNITTTTTILDSSKKADGRSSLSRTLVLAVPLMLKFTLVLMIKFLTDLVVFPLLLTYRAARLTKRRLFKIWMKWTNTKRSTSDTTEATETNLDSYNPNGSVAPNSSSLAP
jgi:hypothetical protein